MSGTSHIRSLAAIAAIGCAMLLGLANPAAARRIDDPALPTARAAATAAPQHTAKSGGDDWTFSVALAGAVLLVVVATVGYARHARTSRRLIA
jgi:hypothetical protein